MNSNMGLNKKDQKRIISIDEILSKVEVFNYNVDIGPTDEEQELHEKKKPKSLEQIRKENLTKLLEIVSELNVAVEANKSSIVTKIKQLHELLQAKLGEDLHLFYLQVVARFLHGYKRTEDIKLELSINHLFDLFLIDIENSLKDFLPTNLNTRLFFEEDKLKEILESIAEPTTGRPVIKNHLIILSNFYIYLVLKNRAHSDFYRQLFKLELIFAEHIASFEPKERNKYLLKFLPETFIDSNPKAKVRSFVYLYFTTHIVELTEEVHRLDFKLNEIRNARNSLSIQVKQLTQEVQIKDSIIAQLSEQGKEKDSIIIKIQEELKASRDRFNYEITVADRQRQEIKTNIVTMVENGLRLELDELKVFADCLSQGDSELLRMYVTNIEQFLNTL